MLVYIHLLSIFFPVELLLFIILQMCLASLASKWSRSLPPPPHSLFFGMCISLRIATHFISSTLSLSVLEYVSSSAYPQTQVYT